MTGADLTEADLGGAVLTNARGLPRKSFGGRVLQRPRPRAQASIELEGIADRALDLLEVAGDEIVTLRCAA